MASQQEIKKYIEDQFSEKLKSLKFTQNLLNFLNILSLLMFAGFFSGVVYLIFFQEKFSIVLFFSLFFSFLIFIVFILVVALQKKKFNKTYVNEIIFPFIKQYYSNLNFDPNNYIGEEEIKNTGINPIFDSVYLKYSTNSYSGNNLISGIFNNSFIRLSNIRIHSTSETRTPSRFTTTSEISYEGITSIFEAGGFPNFKIIYNRDKIYINDQYLIDGTKEELDNPVIKTAVDKKGQMLIYSDQPDAIKNIFSKELISQLLDIFAAYNQKQIRITCNKEVFYVSVRDKLLFNFFTKFMIDIKKSELILDFTEFLNFNKLIQIVFNIKN